jgi:hypothetical protein
MAGAGPSTMTARCSLLGVARASAWTIGCSTWRRRLRPYIAPRCQRRSSRGCLLTRATSSGRGGMSRCRFHGIASCWPSTGRGGGALPLRKSLSRRVSAATAPLMWSRKDAGADRALFAPALSLRTDYDVYRSSSVLYFHPAHLPLLEVKELRNLRVYYLEPPPFRPTSTSTES